MNEAQLSQKIIKALRELPECWAVKTHGTPFGYVGEPDIRGVVLGLAFFLEVKVPGKEYTLTPAQKQALERWRKAGAVAEVVTSVEQSVAIVRRMMARVLLDA